MTFVQFRDYCMERLRRTDSHSTHRQYFKALDTHQEGFLSAPVLMRTFKQAGLAVSEAEVRAILSAFSSESDGRVTLFDFLTPASGHTGPGRDSYTCTPVRGPGGNSLDGNQAPGETDVKQ